MSTPSPLIPQGTFQAQANKGASNVRIAVATIVAIHVVFFGGLLLQGCKRDTKTASTPAAETNTTDLSLPPIDTQYYSNATHLPTDTAQMFTSAPPAAVDNFQSNASTAMRDTLAPSGTAGNIPNPPTDGLGAGTAATTEYTVVRGDTYARIAVRHGTTVNALRKANPMIDPAKLRPGMKLQLPAGAAPSNIVAGQGSITPGAVETPAPAGSGQVYVVKAGDNLTRVAKMHGVTVSQLRAANNLKTSGLKIGQKLKIPAAGSSTNSAGKTSAKKATNSVNL